MTFTIVKDHHRLFYIAIFNFLPHFRFTFALYESASGAAQIITESHEVRWSSVRDHWCRTSCNYHRAVTEFVLTFCSKPLTTQASWEAWFWVQLPAECPLVGVHSAMLRSRWNSSRGLWLRRPQSAETGCIALAMWYALVYSVVPWWLESLHCLYTSTCSVNVPCCSN